MVHPTFTSIKLANFCGVNAEREFVFNPNPEREIYKSNLFEINGVCGSGKTTFVNAFRFLSTCMWSDMPMRAYPSGIHVGRNKNNPDTSNSYFEVCMYADSTKYRYALIVSFDANEVKYEKLEYMLAGEDEWKVAFMRTRNQTQPSTVCLRMYTFQSTQENDGEDAKICLLSDIVGPDKTFLHVAFDYVERAPTPCTVYANWKHIYNAGMCLKNKLIAPVNLLAVPLNRELVCSEKFLHVIQGFDFREVVGITTDEYGNPRNTMVNHYGKWVEMLTNEPESFQKLIEIMNVVLSNPECTVVLDDFDACFHPLLTRWILVVLQENYSGSVIYTTRRDVGEEFSRPKRNIVQNGSS